MPSAGHVSSEAYRKGLLSGVDGRSGRCALEPGRRRRLRARHGRTLLRPEAATSIRWSRVAFQVGDIADEPTGSKGPAMPLAGRTGAVSYVRRRTGPVLSERVRRILLGTDHWRRELRQGRADIHELAKWERVCARLGRGKAQASDDGAPCARGSDCGSHRTSSDLVPWRRRKWK